VEKLHRDLKGKPGACAQTVRRYSNITIGTFNGKPT
jgi:hypothetical protein